MRTAALWAKQLLKPGYLLLHCNRRPEPRRPPRATGSRLLGDPRRSRRLRVLPWAHPSPKLLPSPPPSRSCAGPSSPLSLETISALLLSPFFGAANPADALAAAEFDAFELRRKSLLRPELTLDAIIDLVREGPRAQRIASVLRALFSLRRAAAAEKIESGTEGPQQSHAGWADAFRNLLAAAGWTRATDRDSLSFQTRQRWESALDQLATLDFDGSRVNRVGRAPEPRTNRPPGGLRTRIP